MKKLTNALYPVIQGNPGGKNAVQFQKTLDYMEDHPPDVNWLINVLAIWSPDDEIFEMNYKYVKQRDVVELEFDNSDNFWDLLAPLTEK